MILHLPKKSLKLMVSSKLLNIPPDMSLLHIDLSGFKEKTLRYKLDLVEMDSIQIPKDFYEIHSDSDTDIE